MSVSESGGDWRRARCSLYPTALNAMPRTPYRHRHTPQNEHHSSRNRSRARHVPHNPRPSFWSPTSNPISLLYMLSSTRQTSALRRRYILIFDTNTSSTACMQTTHVHHSNVSFLNFCVLELLIWLCTNAARSGGGGGGPWGVLGWAG